MWARLVREPPRLQQQALDTARLAVALRFRTRLLERARDASVPIDLRNAAFETLHNQAGVRCQSVWSGRHGRVILTERGTPARGPYHGLALPAQLAAELDHDSSVADFNERKVQEWATVQVADLLQVRCLTNAHQTRPIPSVES